MSAYLSTATDVVVTDEPCKLYSVVLTPSAGAVGDVTLYNGSGAESGYEITTLRTASGKTEQVRWRGLELNRGLYVDVGSNVTLLTVEWDPVGYPKKGKSVVEYITEAES